MLSYILASQGRGWAQLGLLWAALTGLQLLLVFVRAKCVQGGTRPPWTPIGSSGRHGWRQNQPSNYTHQLIEAMDCAGSYAC